MAAQHASFVVETDWLEAHLDDPGIRILDCSTYVRASEEGYFMDSGLPAWEKAHIPGSVFADLTTELSDQDSDVLFMIPPAETFARAMSELGVGEGSFVVLYDAFINIWAARTWWMLRSYGFDSAVVLNGGWKKWKRERRPVTTEVVEVPRGEFTAQAVPGITATKDDVLEAMADPEIILIDALTRQEYAGELAVYGRPGHIPTSINIPALELVDRRTRCYLPPEELEKVFSPVFEQNPARIITYCGGGAAGSSVAFALTSLGVENVSVYDGALIEWAADPDLPMETGEPG